MKRILCVAEKPSISKSISNLLSSQVTATPTKNKFIKNYEFERGGDRLTMTALLGHLNTTDYKMKTRWDMSKLNELFTNEIETKTNPAHKDIERNLLALARRSDLLIIWTDCDREGENIGMEVVNLCKTVNPRIEVKRARFSVIQKREICQAYENLVDLDLRLAAAVDARTELDLRIGAIFTRFQTLLLKERFSELQEQKVISYGTCQFPTLGFIVERFLKAKNFIPEEFWSINLALTKGGITTKFNWDRNRVYDHDVALALYGQCNSPAEITSITHSPKSKYPPLPLTTVELQKNGSKYLKISSDRLMHIAEKLYNEGIISYPRTETDTFTSNFQLRPLIEKQVQDPRWGAYATKLLDGAFKHPRSGKHNDQAHPPIHPVRAALNLTGEELKVYEFVTRRFLACCSHEARGNGTTVTAKINSETFKASGLTITEQNYLDVYPYDKWSSNMISPFVNHEFLQPELSLPSGMTTPPSLLTESDLIALMDKSGIGTDATIHEHIAKILERDYTNKEGEFFVPTTLGMSLIKGYDGMNMDISLSKPDLRALMEENMNMISRGVKDRQSVVDEMVAIYRRAFQTVFENSGVMIQTCNEFYTPAIGAAIRREERERPVGDFVRGCIDCGAEMHLRHVDPASAYVVSCSGYPNCTSSKWVPSFFSNVSVDASLCESCTDQVHQLRVEFDGEFEGLSTPALICLWCDQFQGPDCNCRAPSNLRKSTKPGANLGRLYYTCSTKSCQYFQWKDEVMVAADAPNCGCGTPSAMLKTVKEGPNQGRYFYTCPSKTCGFFEWQVQENCAFSGNLPNQVISQPSTRNYHANNEAPSYAPNCGCGTPSAMLKTVKEGPNQGRYFYTCPSKTCGFFEWQVQENPVFSNNQSSFSSQPPLNTSYQSYNSGDRRKCGCDLVAAFKTDKNGREYYKCPKAGKTCKFFEWADGVGNNATANGAGSSNSASICYNCNQPGHFATSCPSGSSGKIGNSSVSTAVCYKCNKSGHFSSSCPSGGVEGPSSKSARGGSKRGGKRGSNRVVSKAKSKIGKQQSMKL